MDCTSTHLSYRQAGVFSKIVLDYLDQSPDLFPFFSFPPTMDGIQKAIDARKHFPTKRDLLVQELEKQYSAVDTPTAVADNIKSFSSAATFTVTTAHQNNIFTGPLYFIYKILHAIKLAEHLGSTFPQYKFVPVYYMGSEDADLAELNHIHLDGVKLAWNTKQTGAVGRMKVDKDLLKLIDAMEGQLAVLPHGQKAITLLRESYRPGEDIQAATFRIVHSLFAEYGLVVLLPDNGVLKQQMLKIFEDDLLNQTASQLVEKTSAELGEFYKVQAHPRDINLFYLLNDTRERIVMTGDRYEVLNSKLSFSKDEILAELKKHPERFSPNVILRGLYQEVILPNIAFIGGGGELAYWLELKNLFDHYKIPYPVQVLRNSFLIVEQKWHEKANKLGFNTEDLFLPEQALINLLVTRDTVNKVQLNGTLSATEQLYEAIKKQAASIDLTLVKHVDSLKTASLHGLKELEKKMLRAEKRKFSDQDRQIRAMKEKLFPGNGLQERSENMLYYFAKWGPAFIEKLHQHSLTLEQEFIVLTADE